MPKKRVVAVQVKCAREECTKIFTKKRAGVKYCSNKCREIVRQEKVIARNLANKEKRKIEGRPKKVYHERVKCPRCEDIYFVNSYFPPPSIMRRKYCRACSQADIEPYYVFSISVQR